MEPQAPAVTCTGCGRTWLSASMAEGLKLLGSCPRCSGVLEFSPDVVNPPLSRLSPEDASSVAPHLVLGIPRF